MHYARWRSRGRPSDIGKSDRAFGFLPRMEARRLYIYADKKLYPWDYPIRWDRRRLVGLGGGRWRWVDGWGPSEAYDSDIRKFWRAAERPYIHSESLCLSRVWALEKVAISLHAIVLRCPRWAQKIQVSQIAQRADGPCETDHIHSEIPRAVVEMSRLRRPDSR